jgi:hypothetical protein
LWTAAFVLVTIDLVLDLHRLGPIAVLLGAGGATLTVRGYLIRLGDHLYQREQNAFELGMDAAERRHLH